MLKLSHIGTLCLAFMFASGCAMLSETMGENTSTSSNDSASTGLTKALTDKLGVTNEQAAGGSGAILGYAKSKLSPNDFNKVTEAVPEAPQLINAAPKQHKLSNQVANLSGGNDSVGGLASLTSSFSKLGLSADMVTKFTPIVLDYVKSSGGEATMETLKGALK